MRDNVTATECRGWLMRIHTLFVKEKGGYFEHKLWHFNSSLIQYSCWRILNSGLLLIISGWIMVWNKAVFCLEVLIYKRLQMWRHNDVIGRNDYLISALSESTVPEVYSLQFLFKSTHYTWRYGRKCEWVFFFWTQCRCTHMATVGVKVLSLVCTITVLYAVKLEHGLCFSAF